MLQSEAHKTIYQVTEKEQTDFVLLIPFIKFLLLQLQQFVEFQ